jgi:signal transduction histidine kinase
MNAARLVWRARGPSAGIIAVGLCASVGLLVWVGFQAVRERQRSSLLLAQQRMNTAADVLATALSRDMRGAEYSVLQSVQPGTGILETSHELGPLFASAFARYPYPESFFVWRGEPVASNVVFFDRVDRPPPWASLTAELAAFPVVITPHPNVAEELVPRLQEDIAKGIERSVFEARLHQVPYQIVVRAFYRDRFREHLSGGLGFSVNLPWVRRFYFPELATEIARVAGVEGFVYSILDDTGVPVTNDGPVPSGSAASRRPFPMLFADPLLVGLNRPPDLPDRRWMVVVQGAGAPADPGSVSHSTTVTLVVAALAAALLTLGLLMTVQAARASADIADIRSDFVSTVTHELKTPLATLRAVGEAITSGRVTQSDTVQEYAQIVIQESKRLTRLVDNSLAYARVTDVADVYHFEPVRLQTILEDSLRGFTSQLTAQEFAVELDLSDNLAPVRGDRVALGLVFDNLVDNAIRYSRDSRWLSVVAKELDRSATVTIADRGVGISAEELTKVRGKFFRGKAAGSGGTGLGLAIADRIVNAHDGRMVIKSAIGGGTSVCVELPTARQNDGEMHTDR